MKNSGTRKVLPPGVLKWGMENAVFFSKWHQYARRNTVYKEAFRL
jgi:hypothetical protein